MAIHREQIKILDSFHNLRMKNKTQAHRHPSSVVKIFDFTVKTEKLMSALMCESSPLMCVCGNGMQPSYYLQRTQQQAADSYWW